MKVENVEKRDELKFQYMFFKAFLGLAYIGFWPFFAILLYKETHSLKIILIERILFFVGLWIGSVVFSLIIDRLGILKSYKTSAVLQGLSIILFVAFMHNLETFYILISLFRGFARGTYWPIEHSVSLREIPNLERGRLISMAASFERLMCIILPFLAGALVYYNAEGYFTLGIVSAAITFLAVFAPFYFNKKPSTQFRSSEITTILKKKSFKKYALISFFDDGWTQLAGSVFLIIPYIIIANEFGVGIFATVVGLFTAIFAFKERLLNTEKKIWVAFLTFFVRGVSYISLGIFWTVPALFFGGLGNSVGSTLGTSAHMELDYTVKEKLLGDFKNESAIEMNLILETIYLFARVLILSFILILFDYSDMRIESFLKIILVVVAFGNLLTTALLSRLNRRLIR